MEVRRTILRVTYYGITVSVLSGSMAYWATSDVFKTSEVRTSLFRCRDGVLGKIQIARCNVKRCQRPVVLPPLATLLVALLGCLATAQPPASIPPGASAAAAPTPPPAKPAPAVAAVPDAPLLADKIRQLMQDRKYAEAIKAIDEASGQPEAPVDYLAWLKGRALFLDSKFDEAIAVFEGVEKQFPKSPWVRRARFAKALTFARKGDFRTAELIYRTEAEYLLSADRKQEIADLYLEFADTYFKPPKEEQKPDYAKALEFYKKALEVGPKPQKQIEVELLVAQCQQNLGQAGRGGRAVREVHEGTRRKPAGR